MDVREKLVELLQDENNPVWGWFPNNMAMMQLADYLISNGVTVQERSYQSITEEKPSKHGTAVSERRTSMSQKYYIAHEVAELLAEVIGDRCACNVNGNDEWLPMVCDFGQTVCPNVYGVACWEQYLKHHGERKEGAE